MVVVAIKNGEEQCGKRVQDSKKKYFWVFRIDSDEFRIQLICSFLSGKKKIILNGAEIYNEQNLFNINFEFVHNINGNCVRLTQNKQSFECRINNMSFTQLTENRLLDPNLHAANVSKQQKTDVDPFAEFSNFMGENVGKKENNEVCEEKAIVSNQFGDFDMNFKFQKQIQNEKVAISIQPIENKPIQNKQNEGFNDTFEQHFKDIDRGFEDDGIFGTNVYANMNKNTTAIINSKKNGNNSSVDTKIGSLFSEIFKL